MGGLGGAPNIPPGVIVSVNPNTATVARNASMRFTVSVTGSTNTAVRWSVARNDHGSVTDDGVFTAPDFSVTTYVVAQSETGLGSGFATITVE